MSYGDNIKKRTAQRKSNAPRGLVGGIITGILTTLVSATALLLICTAIALNNPDPDSLSLPLALFSLFGSSFIGGFSTRKFLKDNSAFAASALSSCMVIILLLAGRLVFPSDGRLSAAVAIICMIAVIGASALGVLTGKPRAAKKRRRKR